MPLPLYPSPPGNKNWSLHGIVGPASYTAVSPASGNPTGGQSVPASSFGLGSIEAAWVVAGSDDGTYYAHIFLSPYEKGGGSPSIIVQWIIAATGAEVAAAFNLSARTLRVMAIGI